MTMKYGFGIGFYENAVNPEYLPPEELWEMIEQLLPPPPRRPKGGRPRMPNRMIFYAIYYVLRTGIQWQALLRAPCIATSRPGCAKAYS